MLHELNVNCNHLTSLLTSKLAFLKHLLRITNMEITMTNRKTAPVAMEIHTTLETPDEGEPLSKKRHHIILVSRSLR